MNESAAQRGQASAQGASGGNSPSRQQHGRAVQSLANEVVTRLANRGHAAAERDAAVNDERIDDLCKALLANDAEAARTLAEEALRRGLDFDGLCETLLAPAARRLGEFWEADRLSFAEVTLAANRLFYVLRHLAPRRQSASDAIAAVFATPPDEEHVLGVTMAAERARALGWHVELVVGQAHEAIVERIVHMGPDVVGLSLGSERSTLAISKLVVALRVAVPDVPVVVCGSGTEAAGRAKNIVGADGVAGRFEEAIGQMERLIGAVRRR